MHDPSPSPTVRRVYHSPARERQAQETRRRMLAAARALLLERGYAGTTSAAIAAAAGVSSKTVAAAFGSKRGILAALVDPTARGGHFQNLIEALRAEPDPYARVVLAARLCRQVYAAQTPELQLLRGAHVVAQEVGEAADEVEARRRGHQARLIAALDEQGVLRAGLSAEAALDILWALTGFDLYRALVLEAGWAPERYEAWLADLLVERLLRPR